jgi:ABC-type Zn uptake system ZnuABC Zn-binding protein ZnuA
MPKPPVFRDHDTYKKDHWSVVDVNGVDRVFATESSSSVDVDPDQVRIDLDGSFAPSTMRDVGDEGDLVNMSVWLDPERAKELAQQIFDSLPNE